MKKVEKKLVPTMEKETVLRWNETCSDCYWFDASTSECTYAKYNLHGDPVHVSPDKSKCDHFRS